MLGGASGAAGLPSTPWPSLHELSKLVRRVRREMPDIETPTLILHARDDDMTATSNADYIEQRLGGPVSKLLLDDCYHMITVDRQRGEVVRATADYFAPLAGAAYAQQDVNTRARARG